eukprot:7256198-Alexandrium_andersonii.AAC.1
MVQDAAACKSNYGLQVKAGGRLLGNMCIVQAMKRPLNSGETRPALLKKCDKGFKKREYMSPDPGLHMLLLNEMGMADEAAAK